MALWSIAVALAGLLAVQAAAGSQPVPTPTTVSDPQAFFAAVRENLAKSQRAGLDYSYKERRTTLHTNPFGKLGTAGVELYQVYPSPKPDLTYRRLLARDGVALSEKELADQDREYHRKTSNARSGGAESEKQRQRREQDQAENRARAQAIVEDVLAVLQFTITGNGEFEGHPAVLVTFAARPGARPKTREGGMAQKFGGRIWIHPELHEVMHVEAKSTDDLAIGFGLVARMNEGAVLTIKREAVEPGVWLPTAVRLSGGGRAFMYIRKLTLDYVVDWFDYQRGAEPPSVGD